ncbi:MAG: hypothetical protein ACLFUJ_15905, partial [Phycisphaerae bacterium]
MARRFPSYCRHKSSGQARVRIDGRDFYLGPYDSPESRPECDRLIAAWLKRQSSPTPPGPQSRLGATVTELIAAYRSWAEGRPGPRLRRPRDHGD